MKIERVKNGSGLILTNEKGESLQVSFMEFWDICKAGDRMDAKDEVENYLRDCDEIGGYDSGRILEYPDLVECITEEVINERINSESLDQIYEAAKKSVSEFFGQAITLMIHEYAGDNSKEPVKTTQFSVTYGALEDYLDAYEDARTVEEFFETYDREEAQVLYDYMTDDGRVLSEETIYCDEFEEEFSEFAKKEEENSSIKPEWRTSKEAYFNNVFYPMKVSNSKGSLEGKIAGASEKAKNGEKSKEEKDMER